MGGEQGGGLYSPDASNRASTAHRHMDLEPSFNTPNTTEYYPFIRIAAHYGGFQQLVARQCYLGRLIARGLSKA